MKNYIIFLIISSFVSSSFFPRETRKEDISPRDYFSAVVIIHNVSGTSTLTGSGFFVDSQIIICNAHAFKSPEDSIWITTHDSLLVGTRTLLIDTSLDIAFLAIDNPIGHPISLSNDPLSYDPDEMVFVIGNPKGLFPWSINRGTWRSGSSQDSTVSYDMFVVPGMSGSLVINKYGDLQGMVRSHKTNDNNVGFIIPTFWIYEKYVEMLEQQPH